MADAIQFPFPEPPAAGEALEVAAGILWMRLPLPLALDHVNVYALAEPDGWTIIDTGFKTEAAIGEWQRLLAGPLAGKPVKRLIVTHNHPDHVGLAGWFQEQGAELWMSQVAWLMARMLCLDVQERPTPQAQLYWQRAGVPAEEIARRNSERPFNFADVCHPLPVGFHRLREGQVLRLGGRDWVVRIDGGHAPDHATLWSDGIVLGGDQLLPGISANIGVYASEPEADPLAEWLESSERLKAFATPEILVLPGHKLPFTGLPFRLEQMIENHRSVLAKLRRHLAEPRPAVDCFTPLFRRNIGAREHNPALAETYAHLNYLHRRGLIARELTDAGIWLWRNVDDA